MERILCCFALLRSPSQGKKEFWDSKCDSVNNAEEDDGVVKL